MTVDTWLRIGTIGLPLIGALILWREKDGPINAYHRLVVSIFVIAGFIALCVFLYNMYYSCMFMLGRENCVFDSLEILSLLLLNLLLARRSMVLHGESKGYNVILMLLLSSAWAGMGYGLARNLGIFLLFLYLFFFVLNRYMNQKGFTGGFLKVRDDYKDDLN